MSKAAKAEQTGDEQAEFLAAVDEGLADVKAGRTVPYEKVRRWLLSWGSDKELPPPKCRQVEILSIWHGAQDRGRR